MSYYHFTKNLVKRSFIVTQSLESFSVAIAEHRWEDALLLLRPVVAMQKCRINPYLIWKALHLIMVNKNVPLKIQKDAIFLVFKSTLGHNEVALDWFAECFNKIDEESVDTLQRAVLYSVMPTLYGKHQILFLSYFALYWYVKWKNTAVLLTNQKCMANVDHIDGEIHNSDGEIPPTDGEIQALSMDCKQLGMKAYSLLWKAYKLHEATQREANECNRMTCEWLLGPILDLEENISTIKDPEKCLRNQEDSDRLLAVMQKHHKAHPNNVPGLRAYYHYLKTYHNIEINLQREVLQKLAALSPESSLVLDYVDYLLESSITYNDENGTTCPLAVRDIDALIECLQLICHFLEFRTSWSNSRAWSLLQSVLKILHYAWVDCWKCQQCKTSRKMVEDSIASSLTIWPEVFWNKRFLKTVDEQKGIWVAVAYSAFVFCYETKFVRKVLKLLKKNNGFDEEGTLLSMIKYGGSFIEKFLSYSAKQYKERFENDKIIEMNENVLENVTLRTPTSFDITSDTFNFRDIDPSAPPLLGSTGNVRKGHGAYTVAKQDHVTTVAKEDHVTASENSPKTRVDKSGVKQKRQNRSANVTKSEISSPSCDKIDGNKNSRSGKCNKRKRNEFEEEGGSRFASPISDETGECENSGRNNHMKGRRIKEEICDSDENVTDFSVEPSKKDGTKTLFGKKGLNNSGSNFQSSSTFNGTVIKQEYPDEEVSTSRVTFGKRKNTSTNSSYNQSSTSHQETISKNLFGRKNTSFDSNQSNVHFSSETGPTKTVFGKENQKHKIKVEKSSDSIDCDMGDKTVVFGRRSFQNSDSFDCDMGNKTVVFGRRSFQNFDSIDCDMGDKTVVFGRRSFQNSGQNSSRPPSQNSSLNTRASVNSTPHITPEVKPKKVLFGKKNQNVGINVSTARESGVPVGPKTRKMLYDETSNYLERESKTVSNNVPVFGRKNSNKWN